MAGQEWQMGLFADPKLLTENADILSSLFATVKATDAEVVLVPGDLSKDGASQQVVTMLGSLGDPTATLLAQLITSLRTDLPPADNTLNVQL